MAFENAIQTLQSWVVSSCETLSIILNQGVNPSPAEVERGGPQELRERHWRGLAYRVGLLSGVEGQFHLLLERRTASRLVDLLVGGDGDDSQETLTELHHNVLREAIQQLTSTLAELLGQLKGHPTKVVLSEPLQGLPHSSVDDHLWLQFPLELDSGLTLQLALLVPVSVAGQLESEPEAAPKRRGSAPSFESAESGEPSTGDGEGHDKPNFRPLKSVPNGPPAGHLDLILEVPLQVQVVLGRTRLLVQDLISLGEGTVLELDKLAGEPVELYVHDRLVALGEVIVVDERFGVKVLELAGDRKARPLAS